VPSKYNGKRVAIKVIVWAKSGDWKSDWYFEGVSFTVNGGSSIQKHKAIKVNQVKTSVDETPKATANKD
jgi:hypothetical protein